MLKDLLKEGGLYTFANLATKGIGLLLLPFYTSVFSPTDYGIIDLLSVFGVLITTIFSLQLNQGLGRYVGDGEVVSKAKIKFASTAIIIVVIIYLTIAFLLSLFPQTLSYLLSNEETVIDTFTINLSIYSVLLGGIFYFLGVYLRFLRRAKEFSILSFAFAFCNILFMLYFILILEKGIHGIYLSTITVAPIFILIALFRLRNDLKIIIGKEELRKMFKYSAPLIPAAVAYLLLNSIDRFYLKEMKEFESIGIYGIAFRFSSVITLIITGFSMAMNPIIFERHHLKSTKLEIKKMFSYFFVIGSSGLLILSLFSKETIFLFTNEKYYGAEDLMPLMYITVAITGLGLFSPGINIEKKTKLGAIIIIGSALLNVVLNYFFILNWGAFGAASATLLSVLFFYVIYFLISQRYYKIPINFIKIFPFLFLNLAIIFFGCYIYQSDNWIEEIIMKIICSLFYIAVIVISFFRKKNDR